MRRQLTRFEKLGLQIPTVIVARVFEFAGKFLDLVWVSVLFVEIVDFDASARHREAEGLGIETQASQSDSTSEHGFVKLGQIREKAEWRELRKGGLAAMKRVLICETTNQSETTIFLSLVFLFIFQTNQIEPFVHQVNERF